MVSDKRTAAISQLLYLPLAVGRYSHQGNTTTPKKTDFIISYFDGCISLLFVHELPLVAFLYAVLLLPF